MDDDDSDFFPDPDSKPDGAGRRPDAVGCVDLNVDVGSSRSLADCLYRSFIRA